MSAGLNKPQRNCYNLVSQREPCTIVHVYANWLWVLTEAAVFPEAAVVPEPALSSPDCPKLVLSGFTSQAQLPTSIKVKNVYI